MVIAMQRGFLEPGAALAVPAGRAIIPSVGKLIENCRQRRVPCPTNSRTAWPWSRGDRVPPREA
jgi:nicotinamidase-related amidase